MDQRIVDAAIERIDVMLSADGATEASVAKKINISRGTLRKLRKYGSNVHYTTNVMAALSAIIGISSQSSDLVYRFFENGLGVPSKERETLLRKSSGDYAVYKLYSKGNSVLVTHLTVSVEGEVVTFVDRTSIRNPYEKKTTKYATYEHFGMVFHRRNTVYFLNAAGSNLRLMSVEAQGLFDFGEASGLLMGTNRDWHTYATRVHIRRVNEAQAKKLRGHYLLDDRTVRDELEFINNDMGSISVLVGKRLAIGET